MNDLNTIIDEPFVSQYLDGDGGIYYCKKIEVGKIDSYPLSILFKNNNQVDLHVYSNRHLVNPTRQQFLNLYRALTT